MITVSPNKVDNLVSNGLVSISEVRAMVVSHRESAVTVHNLKIPSR